MALNDEDKADVKRAMGKAIANKITKVTNDRSKHHVPHSKKDGISRFGLPTRTKQQERNLRDFQTRGYLKGSQTDIDSKVTRDTFKAPGHKRRLTHRTITDDAGGRTVEFGGRANYLRSKSKALHGKKTVGNTGLTEKEHTEARRAQADYY